MSEELNQESEIPQDADAENAADEFEEISSDEVDRIVESLESLIGSTESENIQTYLEEAMNNVYYLVYDEESEDDVADDVAEAA